MEPAIRTTQATVHWDNDSGDVSLWLGMSGDLSRASWWSWNDCKL